MLHRLSKYDQHVGGTTPEASKPASNVLLSPFVRLLCWWFGCQEEATPYYVPPEEARCFRCGEAISYAHLVGQTRHNFTVLWLKYWLWRKWVPTKCLYCGKRYGKHEDCIPF